MGSLNRIILEENYAVMLVNRKDKTLRVKIDIEDIEKIIPYMPFHAIEDKTLHSVGYYMCHRYTKGTGKKCVKLHRLIMNCPEGMEIDHINHDTLDNRKSNLRVCSRFENQQNLRSCKSGTVGVHQRKRGNWVGSISKDGKRYSKEFKTKAEALSYREEMYSKLYKGGD